VPPAPLSRTQPYMWSDFEDVAARAAVGSTSPRPGFRQWVVDQRGTYNGRATSGSAYTMSSFPGASPSSYGRQIVIFKGEGTIRIQRSFGPTILAPFAHVIIDGSVGCVRGPARSSDAPTAALPRPAVSRMQPSPPAGFAPLPPALPLPRLYPFAPRVTPLPPALSHRPRLIRLPAHSHARAATSTA
jgi:hypothetical protein